MTNPTNEQDTKNTQAAQQIADAHNLLTELRKELNQHPGLEQAILKLENALNLLTTSTGGLL